MARYETATKAKAALDYGVESAKVLAAVAAVVGGYPVDVVSVDGRVTRGKVVDFSAEGIEVKPRAGFEFNWGYGILVPWHALVVIERLEEAA